MMIPLKQRWVLIPIFIAVAYFANMLYRLPKYDAGEKSTDFTAVLSDGSQFSLSSMRGSYVLLDFWASWCGPCRRENPALVALFNETRGKHYQEAASFEIVSIAIETNEEKWQRAVSQDGLVWKYQIAEFDRFSSPLATLYGVKEIPTKYLIDPQGQIIRVNPAIEEVASFLKEQEEP
jgi:thiol-disulfide isomerase/thioredoxin